MSIISIVVPLMNEEGNLPLLYDGLRHVMLENGDDDFEILFVDDGSSDGTLSFIKQLSQRDSRVKYLSFSRNFGHQNALKAGLDAARGDAVISMDGDLQHPPELITEMLKHWRGGDSRYEVVYTIRLDHPRTGFFKHLTSRLFYSLMNLLSDVKVDIGSADFRLLDRSVLQVIKNLHENPIFFRGMIKWLGFRQISIAYMPHERYWGSTKYSVKKMFSFALSGITSFSIKPLHFSTFIGVGIAFLSFIFGLYAIYEKIFTNNTIQGWASLMILVSFLGGIQLIMIGILGEYLGKLFIEQKRRPTYIVKEHNLD